MAQPKTGKEAREAREKMLILKHKFENRITITKFGKEAFDNGDYSTALRRFTEYLTIMAEIKEVNDFYSLSPSHFNPHKDITEMLMISHLYFELARIYDAVPKFQEDSKKCLDQFVSFSVNQPFQVVNSEMIRKNLKKTSFKNPEVFRLAYEQIYVQSKKCYVVTFCYGSDAPITNQYRDFKDWLLDRAWGREIVRLYYKNSSVAVKKWEQNPLMHYLAKFLICPLLVLFSKTLLPLIIKKC